MVGLITNTVTFLLVFYVWDWNGVLIASLSGVTLNVRFVSERHYNGSTVISNAKLISVCVVVCWLTPRRIYVK